MYYKDKGYITNNHVKKCIFVETIQWYFGRVLISTLFVHEGICI